MVTSEETIFKDKLRYSDDTSFCYSRKRCGRGFSFFDEKNRRISDPSLKARFKSLVIPPMWSEVKICKWDDGHLQATGRDNKGRKQYIYHNNYEAYRQERKYAKMIHFGKSLPELRALSYEYINQPHWSREKVLALICLILDETGIRIGNSYYTEKNGTHGLTTLRRKHLELVGEELKFNFTGKKNIEREVTIDDQELIALIKKSAERPGYEIFRYKSDDGSFDNVSSEDVNEFIHKNMGPSFSSKDFRTWVGTRLAVEFYEQAQAVYNENQRKKLPNIVLRMVADELGNSPTICRSYYVHPEIYRLIEDEDLPLASLNYHDDLTGHGHSAAEKLILDKIG